MASLSGFWVVLSAVERNPQVRLLNVARVQGSVPRATKMSTSFEGNVQSTDTVKVPVCVVVESTAGATPTEWAARSVRARGPRDEESSVC